MSEEKKWTESQKNAISARNGTILVSAAAGSGKTAVLVQRMVERLTDKKNPSDADRLLIVTFTNAAASEMRERISRRIDELLSDDPLNRNLQRQQILLTKANISTIHSFCSDLIHEYFYKLDVSSEFRIADEHEMMLLRDEAIDRTLEEYYQKGSKNFYLAVETFSGTKDDKRFVSTVKALYDFINSHPYPEIWLDRKLADYQDVHDVNDTSWANIILSYAKSAIDFCLGLTDLSIDISCEDEKLYKTFEPVLSSDREGLSNINFSNWDTVYKRLNFFEFKTLRAPRGYADDPIKLRVAENRKQVKESIKKLQKIFSVDEKKCMDDLQSLSPIIRELFSVVKDFGRHLKILKSERNVLDFVDLEHLTINLLSRPKEDGFEKTEEALSIGELFDEIMVDEYQDTNETQDTIFRALSNDEKNLFVVGDVKQSIYGFRQAMPEIFLRRKEKYEKYNPSTDAYPARIVLDSNFRSREGITDAVNFVFKQLMSKDVGDVNYSDEEKLTAAASYEKKNTADMELHLIDLSNSFSDDMDVFEAKYIADIIKKKISSGEKVKDADGYRELKLSDICVLLRSANVHAANFVRELEKNEVPACSDSNGGLLSFTEVSTIISLLRIIDNPVQDIPLLSVLMSPLVMLSPDDAAEIRLANREVPLYFALKDYANERNSDVIKKFLTQLEEYRYLAATLSCSQLVSLIYTQTNFESMVQTMKNGKQKLANLRMLLEHIKAYESSGQNSVSGFIRFIDRLQEQNSDLMAPSVVSDFADAVRVLSIHKSKGLEFPVCIIANGSRKFNKEKGDVLLHSELGVGVKLRDTKKMYAYNNFVRNAILLELDKNAMSEELRVLYVAMTRARENLIILCSFKDVEKTIISLANKVCLNEKISPQTVKSASSFSDWIIMCALKHKDGEVLRKIADIGSKEIIECEHPWDVKIVSVDENDVVPVKNNFESESKEKVIDQDLLRTMSERFNYEYKFKKLSGIPAKVSVSEIAHRDLEPDEEVTLSRPSFVSERGMTATEKGTALHEFMQFADFKKAAKSLKDHVDELVQKGFLTQKQSEVINFKKVSTFLKSDVAKRITKSDNVLREFRFTINMDVNEFKNGLNLKNKTEYVILQGAIDCAFEENGKFVIVDYKTDHISSMDELSKKYKRQLELYKRALEECTGKEVSQCIIYSLHLGKSIRV